MYIFKNCELIKMDLSIELKSSSHRLPFFIYKMNLRIFLVDLIPRYFLVRLLAPEFKDNVS